MKIKRRTMWTRSTRLTSEEARPTLATHSSNKSKLSNRHHRQGSIRAWDSKLSILTQIHSLKSTTSLVSPLVDTRTWTCSNSQLLLASLVTMPILLQWAVCRQLSQVDWTLRCQEAVGILYTWTLNLPQWCKCLPIYPSLLQDLQDSNLILSESQWEAWGRCHR